MTDAAMPPLRIATAAIPDAIDPAALLGSPASLAGNAYWPVFGPHGLASAWEAFEAADDGRTFTALLAPGVYSAGGELLASDDIVWSWSRAFALGGPLEARLRAAGLAGFEGVEYVNRQTVRFRLGRSNEDFEQLLRAGEVPLIDSKTARRRASTADLWARDWLRSNSAGFGAYAVARFAPGERLVLNGVPGSALACDEVIVERQTDPVAAIRGVAGGDYDLAISAGPASVGTSIPTAGAGALQVQELTPASGPAGDGGLVLVSRGGLTGFQWQPLAGVALALLQPAATTGG